MASYHEQLDHLTREISDNFPGNDLLTSQLITLITTCPPTFTYLHDPHTPRATASLVNTLITSLSAIDAKSFTPEDDVVPIIASAQVNAIACFSPRLFYDTTFNRLAKWRPRWEDGCENWPGRTAVDVRYNDSLDGFLHGLRALAAQLCGDETKVQSPRKGRERSSGRKAVKLVLVVERAERLKESLPELVVPLTRLAELSRVDIQMIFISQSPWDDIKPPIGAAIDPFHLSVYPPSREETLQILTSRFPTDGDVAAAPHPYHPALAQLYAQYATAVYSTCSPFTHDPHELTYVAAAQWPSFIALVLEAQKGATEFHVIPEDLPFLPSFTAALEVLLPRRMHAGAWSQMSDLDEGSGVDAKSVEIVARSLPTLQKYILLSAFLASSNPPRTDMRMFGRSRDIQSKRRRGGSTRKTPQRSASAPAKVPQRLAGPSTFPLDRMNAILATLLEEHDLETRAVGPEFIQPGEYTEIELMRVHTSSAISELAATHLLLRVSPPERLDGPPMYKCGISFDVALALGRDMGIPLLDLIWEAA
ncbi:putative origin recognition complex, subunit 5-like protein [Russula earlei]|uniref:Origin recognition complex, subunit 5-like protein n=1 Tax=Russula earlei TaxID=71964 RepID=A0ACC0TXP6_9AGAM|nr:putative origin recognition complex, subunit 5-like protein [Russula earlei]